MSTTGQAGDRELQPCGTIAAYNRHITNGEPADDACREAKRVYQTEYRAIAPLSAKTRAYNKAYAAARYRALKRLCEMPAHQARFAELVAERLKPSQEPWRVYGPAQTALSHEAGEDYARLLAEERAARGLTP